MQTRKRSIDSVLNLVNPKRLKHLSANQKKEPEKLTGTPKRKKGENSTKGSSKNKNKEGNVTNNSAKEACDKNLSCDGERLKNESRDRIKIDLNTADKPFKKRPVVIEKSSETVIKSDKKEVKNQGGPTQSEDISANSLLTVEVDLKAQGQDCVHKTETEHGKQCGSEFASKATNTTEIDSLKLKKNAVVKTEINVSESARNDLNVANGVIELKPKPKTGLLKYKIDLEPESDDEDDEFIDAGAVEDDMDADFVVPKKEEKENLTRLITNSKVKLKPTNVIDVTKIKADGTENEALEKNSKHICVYCEKDFLTSHRLKKHLVMHTGAKPYKCEKCDMRFGLNTYLTRHMDIHLDDSQKPFVCGSCPKRFSRKGSLDIHQVSHQDVKPFTCPICFKKFKRKMTLQCHSKVHKHGKMYICQYCGKSFGFRSTLGAHILKHSDVKPYTCNECGKGYYTKQSFHDHTMRHKKIKEVECQICNRRYYNKKELRKHMAFHTNPSNFRCEPCKMFFKDAHCRRIHMVKAHKKDYSCDFCEEKFANLRNLKTHIFRKHRELRNARRHKMPMHEKANFKHVLCDFCGKELSNKYRLKTHLLAKHSGVKRIRAPHDPNKVKGPVKTYPSGLKVLCTICNKVMYNKYKLYKHMEKMHDIPLDEISKIELVKLYDGINNDSDIELRERYGDDIDVQTIVIKPATVNSNETETISDHGVQYEGSTVHYVDSQGNILYTDASNGKGFMNDYIKMEYDMTESGQEVINTNTSKSEPTLIEMGRNGAISLLAKGQNNLDFPRSIVDYAAKAANIIDTGEGDLSETSINVTKGKAKQTIVSSNKAVESRLGTASTSNSQDITFIVQQATNRIAAHEQVQNSRSLLNKTIECPTEDGIKLIVNDAANLEGVLEGYSDEGVKYIIEETVDENINISDLGYVVKEDQSNVLSDVVQPESLDTDQLPKIIIIDEQGEEQILSDQMKIIYDPETGLYTYIVEEVVDQQDDENKTVQQISDNGDYKWVILDEEQIATESPPTTHEVPNQSTESRSQAGVDGVMKTEQSISVDYHQRAERLKHNNAEMLDQPYSKPVSDSHAPSFESSMQNQHSITVVSSDVRETHLGVEPLTFSTPSETLAHEYSVATSIDKMPLDSSVVSNLRKTATNINTVSIEAERVNKGLSNHPVKSSEVNDTSLNVSELSVFISPEIITSFNEGQTQEPKLFAGAVDSSRLLSSTEPVASCSGAKGSHYSYQDKPPPLHLQHESLDTDTAMDISVGETSSNTRVDVTGTDANHLIQSAESVLKTDFPQLDYSSNMLNLDASVPLQNEHDQSNTEAENVILDNAGQELEAVMPEDTESEISEMGNKKDLIQLENILKSGIREVSNTVEYSSFLDRMIDHLQSAKENANVPEKEIQTDGISSNQ